MCSLYASPGVFRFYCYLPYNKYSMARIFNIYFTYNASSHNAIVSVRQTPFFTEYTLTNFNEDLLELLPSNKIISKGPGHFVFQSISSEYAEASLMKEIIRAVTEHLHATEA